MEKYTQVLQTIAWALLAVFIISLTQLRYEWFKASDATIWLYRILAPIGLVLGAWALGRFFGKRTAKWMLLLLCLSEIGLVLGFWAAKNNQPISGPLASVLRYIYLFHARNAPLFGEESGQYDDKVFYKLRPGVFEFSNIEFSTGFQVNTAGFRDGEADLQAPEIVFLGDSYTMGWGVEQSESYAELLPQKLGKKSLNCGIASFGTAREWLVFKDLPLLDSCRLVVLQFCPNDIVENRAMVENDFKLPISSREKYQEEVRWNRVYRYYFPFKYVNACLSYVLKKMFAVSFNDTSPSSNTKGISEQGVADFFMIVEKIKASFGGQIVLFNLGMNNVDEGVVPVFEEYLSKHPIPGVHTFNAQSILAKEDYFLLDMHLKPSGNLKIADGLERMIREGNLLVE